LDIFLVSRVALSEGLGTRGEEEKRRRGESKVREGYMEILYGPQSRGLGGSIDLWIPGQRKENITFIFISQMAEKTPSFAPLALVI